MLIDAIPLAEVKSVEMVGQGILNGATAVDSNVGFSEAAGVAGAGGGSLSMRTAESSSAPGEAKSPARWANPNTSVTIEFADVHASPCRSRSVMQIKTEPEGYNSGRAYYLRDAAATE